MNNNTNNPNSNVDQNNQPTMIDPNAINQVTNPTVQEDPIVTPLEQQPQELLEQAQNQEGQPSMNAQSTQVSKPQVVRTENQVVKQQVIKEVATPNNNNNNNNASGNQPPTANNVKNTNVPPEKGTKLKRFLTFLLFAALLVFVYFLPEITEYINYLRNKEETEKVEDITTGKLSCSLSKTTNNLNVSITANFSFTDKKLKTLTYSTEYSGEAGQDEEEINELKNQCQLLKQNTTGLDGIKITCNSGSITTKTSQYFRYEELEVRDIEAAYSEAGGVYPEFELDQNIDTIRKNMERAKYTCEITKS